MVGYQEELRRAAQEKRKRPARATKSRRTFATAVGSLEEIRSTENEDSSDTPRDWCAREMTLKLYTALF